MNVNSSFSVLTANIISIMLIGTLYFSNKQKMIYNKEMRLVLRMMLITVISNIADCCVFYLDGNSNPVVTVLSFISGSWLFFGNIAIGYTWAEFLMTHLNNPFSKTRKRVYTAVWITAVLLLVVNIFYPIVFINKDGFYQRGPAYGVFLIFALYYMADSLYLYFKCIKKAGTLKLFPVQAFLVPIVLGVTVQVLFVEIAITWTSIAIAIAGIMAALKNEIIFLDCLTGLYNREYLNYLQKQACRKENEWISGIMIDLNGFKEINDNYGHSEGDRALILAADLLQKSFGEYGVVTRYAGDEFVVILNTTDEQLIRKMIECAKNIFAEENAKHDRPYELSASMGYGIVNLSDETVDDFMNRIDRYMYRDKLKYYGVCPPPKTEVMPDIA